MRRVVLALTLLAAGCLSVPVRPPALQFNTPGTGKWEYRQEALCQANNTETLNRLGRDGWELVAITPSADASQQCWIHTFKRRLRDR